MKPMDEGSARGPRETPGAAAPPERPGTWIARYKPDLSIRFFSSSADAARARRPTDVVLVLFAAATLGLVSIVAPDPTAVDQRIAKLVNDLPGLLGWFWETASDLLVLWPLVLLVAAVVATRRLFLLRDQLLSTVLAAGVAALVAGGFSALADGLTATGPPTLYPAVRVALATALIATTSPHLSRPIRRLGRWIVILGSLGVVALAIALPLGVVSGLAIGLGSAALVHLAFGSPGGLPSLDQVRAALEELGVETIDLRSAELQPKGVALLRAETPQGLPLLVKVYGRDAWDGQLLTATWSYLWYRDESPTLTISRRQQVEHEAFVTLLAERSGVPVLPVIAAGVVGSRDGVLVLEADARPIQELAPAEMTDALLADLWRAVSAMHEAGIAHGNLDGQRMAVSGDGSALIGDFQAASASATPPALLADRARLLVTTALMTGDDRWAKAALASLGADGLTEVLPYIQPAALSRATRRSLKDAGHDLDAIRDRAAAEAGTEPPKIEPLRRVTIGSVLTIALLLLAAYFVFTAIASVGIDQVVAEIGKADKAWLWVGLVIVPLVPVAEAFGALGATMLPLRLGPGDRARVRDPVHRARGPELGRTGRRERPLLPTAGGAGRPGAHDRVDRQRVRVRRPGAPADGDRVLGAGDPRPLARRPELRPHREAPRAGRDPPRRRRGGRAHRPEDPPTDRGQDRRGSAGARRDPLADQARRAARRQLRGPVPAGADPGGDRPRVRPERHARRAPARRTRSSACSPG